jgi:hypothetical protein
VIMNVTLAGRRRLWPGSGMLGVLHDRGGFAGRRPPELSMIMNGALALAGVGTLAGGGGRKAGGAGGHGAPGEAWEWLANGLDVLSLGLAC